MKAARTVGGLGIVLTLAALFLAGARSGSGRQIVDPLGDSAQATGRSLGQTVTGWFGVGWIRDLAGNPWAGLGVAATLALAVVFLVPGGSTSRGRIVALLAGAAVGLAVYNPQIIGGAV